MKIFIRGKGSTVLRQQDFKAKGGEGKIYVQGNTAFKIYEDLNKLIPEGKIKELQSIRDDHIIKPIDIILDKRNRYIGFTMNLVSGVALCKLFTNSFRDSNGIKPQMTVDLVETIKKVTYKVHEAKCLIVDGNEFNYLVSKDYVTPYFIDVNSWQTPNYPATAIMPSIRDYRSKTFSEVTDWFSFAIVSCQLFIGIHPFKGRHPRYKKNDFISRMKDNISIFNSEVQLPAVVRDFSLIPKDYRSWYINIFEKGDRSEPPGLPVKLGPISVRKTVINSTDNFDIREILKLKEKVLFHAVINGLSVSKSGQFLYIGSKKFHSDDDEEIIFTPKMNKAVGVSIKNNKLILKSYDTNSDVQQINLDVTDSMIVENTLFVKYEGKFMEIDLLEMGNKIVPTIKMTWDVMPKSTEMFSGVLYENILGKPYLVIPIPDKKTTSINCHHIHIKELEKYKVLDAKYERGVCVINCHDGNKHDRLIIKFNDTHASYDVMVEEDVDYLPINFVVLDTGIVVMIPEDKKVLIFSNQYSKTAVKEINDPAIAVDMKLVRDGNKLRFFKDNKIFSFSMKK